MQNFFTLDKVIRGLLVKTGEDSEHKYGLYTTFAHSFLEEFINDSAREARTTRLAMAPDRAITLPDDYIDWVKVGLETENGEVIPLHFNPAMVSGSGRKTADFMNYSGNGQHYGSLTCTGEFSPYSDLGEFKVDNTRKIMHFSSRFDVGPVYLEYLSSAIDICEDTPLHPYAKAALELYIKWQEALYKGESRATYWERLYWNERRRLTARIAPFSPAMMQEIINANFTTNIR
jgi:hypothetical protein